MELIDRYNQAFDDTLKAGENWESWFDLDGSAHDPIEAFEFELAENVAREMLLAGVTYWEHPGWIRDISGVLYAWVMKGQLIKARLFGQWLLSTLPADPLDQTISRILQAYASADFLAVTDAQDCDWPAPPEYYRQTLQWQMVAEAEVSDYDRLMEKRATVNAKVIAKTGKGFRVA